MYNSSSPSRPKPSCASRLQSQALASKPERTQSSTFERARPVSKAAGSRSQESVGKHLKQDLDLLPQGMKRPRGSVGEVWRGHLAVQPAAEDEELSAVREKIVHE